MQETESTHSSFERRRPPGRRRIGSPTARHIRALPGLVGLAVLVALSGPTRALAFQGGEDASTLPVLIDKKAGLADKLQLSAMFSTTLSTKFTDSIGGTLNVQYNPIDWLGLELVGGFFGTSEAQILGAIRRNVADEAGAKVDPGLPDMAGIQWLTGLNVVLVPVYGKISFASEWNPSFDLYFLAGAGVVGAELGQANGQAPQGFATPLPPDSTTTSVEFQFNVGGGLRVFVLPDFAVRLDVRNYFFTDPRSGFSGFGGTFTSALAGQAGVQINFGGSQ